MSKKSVLSVLEQNSLMGLNEGLIIFHHTFSASDLEIIKQRRGAENRLGWVALNKRSQSPTLFFQKPLLLWLEGT